jgi:hypothetical protein
MTTHPVRVRLLREMEMTPSFFAKKLEKQLLWSSTGDGYNEY